jgi:hypothetical protein
MDIMDTIPKEILRIFLGLVPSFGFQRYSPPRMIVVAHRCDRPPKQSETAWREKTRGGLALEMRDKKGIVAISLARRRCFHWEFHRNMMGLWWDFDRKWWFPKLIERKPGKWETPKFEPTKNISTYWTAQNCPEYPRIEGTRSPCIWW